MYLEFLVNMFKELSYVYNVKHMSTGYNNISIEKEREIISKIKFINRIKKGEKINTYHQYIQPNNIFTVFSRTFINKDNRLNAYLFCEDTINRGFELLTTYERSDNDTCKILYNSLLDDLEFSIPGLENLKNTYITDTKFCCDMDTLIENIKAKLQRFNKIEEINKNEQEQHCHNKQE